MKLTGYFTFILLCLNGLTLSSCGIKPAYVDPPQGAEHDSFPRTYPDVNNDPKPGMEQKHL